VHPERVSAFELFFDLVFVFTITQLTGALHADSSVTGVVRVLLMLAVIWWMYGGYAWITNAVSHRGDPARGARAQRDSAASVIDVTRVNASAGFTGAAILRRRASRRPRRAGVGRSGKTRLAA
jgi:hypothetical protein